MGKNSRRHGTANARRTHTIGSADPRTSSAAEVERVLGLVLRDGVWPRGWQPDELAVADVTGAGSETNPVLARIRALLAKAESTDYQAEAEAFTAKAQAMMAEEHLDEAAVRGRAGTSDGGRVSAIRLPLDEPYVAEKAFLLHVVAEANDARAVQHGELALSTVVGPAGSLSGIELLFTSLLIQVQAALTADTCAAPAGSRARSRRYRASFIVGFAHRIGERLAEARARAVAAAPSDALPVLAADRRATSELLDRLVGPTFVDRSRATRDPLGVASGARAADRAALRDAGLARPDDRREHRPLDAVGR